MGGPPNRRFLCLFWRETRQRGFGLEISAWPEEVTGRQKRVLEKEARAVGDGTAERRVSKGVGVEPRTGAVNMGHRNGETSREDTIYQPLRSGRI